MWSPDIESASVPYEHIPGPPPVNNQNMSGHASTVIASQ